MLSKAKEGKGSDANQKNPHDFLCNQLFSPQSAYYLFPIRYNLIINFTLMLKSQPHVKPPNELLQIQKQFLAEINYSDQKIAPLTLPFYNFVCYTIDLFTQFAKCSFQITFNLFIIDYHLRKYQNPVELYRRFMGFISSWRKYSDHDETKLFLTFLNRGRNQRKHVKLFLKLRKILLKAINQKVLQEINLTHQDAVTIVHTMTLISPQQKRTLTKKVNEYFITKNLKYVNSTKFNSAIICEYFMSELSDKVENIDRFNSSLTNKINKILEKRPEDILEFQEESISVQEESFDHDTYESLAKRQSKIVEDKENTFQAEEIIDVQEVKEMHQKSLVNLDQCLKELGILKERDMQIDNRFKKLNLTRDQLK